MPGHHRQLKQNKLPSQQQLLTRNKAVQGDAAFVPLQLEKCTRELGPEERQKLYGSKTFQMLAGVHCTARLVHQHAVQRLHIGTYLDLCRTLPTPGSSDCRCTAKGQAAAAWSALQVGHPIRQAPELAANAWCTLLPIGTLVTGFTARTRRMMHSRRIPCLTRP